MVVVILLTWIAVRHVANFVVECRGVLIDCCTIEGKANGHEKRCRRAGCVCDLERARRKIFEIRYRNTEQGVMGDEDEGAALSGERAERSGLGLEFGSEVPFLSFLFPVDLSPKCWLEFSFN